MFSWETEDTIFLNTILTTCDNKGTFPALMRQCRLRSQSPLMNWGLLRQFLSELTLSDKQSSACHFKSWIPAYSVGQHWRPEKVFSVGTKPHSQDIEKAQGKPHLVFL